MIVELLEDWHPSDATRPYWEAAAAGHLCLQRCPRCDTVRFPPRAICTACGSMSPPEWLEASGRGWIYSSTVVERALLPALRDAVPYVLAIVKLDEGPRMLSIVRGAGGQAVAIGTEVMVAFEPTGVDAVLPVFELI
jgi:uncharacterized OB-fold protein